MRKSQSVYSRYVCRRVITSGLEGEPQKELEATVVRAEGAGAGARGAPDRRLPGAHRRGDRSPRRGAHSAPTPPAARAELEDGRDRRAGRRSRGDLRRPGGRLRRPCPPRCRLPRPQRVAPMRPRAPTGTRYPRNSVIVSLRKCAKPPRARPPANGSSGGDAQGRRMTGARRDRRSRDNCSSASHPLTRRVRLRPDCSRRS